MKLEFSRQIFERYSDIVVVVGIATRYSLDGQGIESRPGQDFPHHSRPVLRLNQPPSCTLGTGSFPGVMRPGRDFDHPPHLAPRLKNEQNYTSSPHQGLRALYKDELYSDIKFHTNPTTGSRVVPYGQTDRQTYMTKCPLSLGNGRSPYGHINQRLQIKFRAPDDERCARSKHVEPLKKFGIINSITKAASCWYFY